MKEEQMGPFPFKIKSWMARLQKWIDGEEHGFLKSDVAKALERIFELETEVERWKSL